MGRKTQDVSCVRWALSQINVQKGKSNTPNALHDGSNKPFPFPLLLTILLKSIRVGISWIRMLWVWILLGKALGTALHCCLGSSKRNSVWSWSTQAIRNVRMRDPIFWAPKSKQIFGRECVRSFLNKGRGNEILGREERKYFPCTPIQCPLKEGFDQRQKLWLRARNAYRPTVPVAAKEYLKRRV